ncbi:uncharacterized protein AKAME5_000030400 [Lates japonicus]|uniref:Uncharacterized protein n=1 Tax=Lates japonicus TaxID=270547 RepID=A0AAD3M2U8_LATJO|nr:uncharacterized protein AKAME5_000030400 [Lates japonicus]
MIQQLATSLKDYVIDSEIDWKKLYDQEKRCTKTAPIKDQFNRVYEELKKEPKNKLCETVLSLCKSSITICEELEEYTPQKKWGEKRTKEMIEKIKKLNDDALVFYSESKATLGSSALASKPPMMYKAESDSSGHKSAGQRATENARFRVEQSQEQLKQAWQSYEKFVENAEKNQKDLDQILIELQECKITEIDFDTKIKMLVKGLDAMGRVKEQWEKMVRFFQMVSNIVQTSLSKTLHNFITTSDGIKTLSYNGKLFSKDLLYIQAFEASNIASLVHMISGAYTEVSNKYLMDRVSGLGRLMAMDKEKPEFHQERQKLQDSCWAAQDGILKLVLKNKEEFQRKTDARMKKIEGKLKPFCQLFHLRRLRESKNLFRQASEKEKKVTTDSS